MIDIDRIITTAGWERVNDMLARRGIDRNYQFGEDLDSDFGEVVLTRETLAGFEASTDRWREGCTAVERGSGWAVYDGVKNVLMGDTRSRTMAVVDIDDLRVIFEINESRQTP